MSNFPLFSVRLAWNLIAGKHGPWCTVLWDYVVNFQNWNNNPFIAQLEERRIVITRIARSKATSANVTRSIRVERILFCVALGTEMMIRDTTEDPAASGKDWRVNSTFAASAGVFASQKTTTSHTPLFFSISA